MSYVILGLLNMATKASKIAFFFCCIITTVFIVLIILFSLWTVLVNLKISFHFFPTFTCVYLQLGHAVAQLVEALCYQSEGRGFDSRWCHWNFSLT